MCPGLADPSNPLACIPADQCMKFCDDMPSAAMPPRWLIQRIKIRTIWLKVFQLRHRSAEMHANGLLGSAKPQHTEPSDQSAVKRLTMVIDGARTEFSLD